MKKFSSLHKGFTLVELMIVIAIIGILAAVLYPAMTGYFERSRDTNRQGALRNVALALHAYKTDNLQYPGSTTTKCLSDISNNLTPASGQTYIKSLPTDPNQLNVDGCTNGSYGYKWTKESTSGTAAGGSSIIAANMEIKGNATMPKSVWAASAGIVSADVINLTAKTNPHSNLAANNTKGEWYLTMAQE